MQARFAKNAVVHSARVFDGEKWHVSTEDGLKIGPDDEIVLEVEQGKAPKIYVRDMKAMG